MWSELNIDFTILTCRSRLSRLIATTLNLLLTLVVINLTSQVETGLDIGHAFEGCASQTRSRLAAYHEHHHKPVKMVGKKSGRALLREEGMSGAGSEMSVLFRGLYSTCSYWQT